MPSWRMRIHSQGPLSLLPTFASARSISELNTITSQIASDVSILSARAIALQSWEPVLSQDDVKLVLAPPRIRPFVATYAANAQADFNGMFGPGRGDCRKPDSTAGAHDGVTRCRHHAVQRWRRDF